MLRLAAVNRLTLNNIQQSDELRGAGGNPALFCLIVLRGPAKIAGTSG